MAHAEVISSYKELAYGKRCAEDEGETRKCSTPVSSDTTIKRAPRCLCFLDGVRSCGMELYVSHHPIDVRSMEPRWVAVLPSIP